MVPELRKMVSRSSFVAPGTYTEECEGGNSLVNKLNVSNEYKQTFRTKSYIEMCSNVQYRLQYDYKIKNITLSNLSESIAHTIQCYNLHPLLVDYFKITIKACNLCELLLRNIHQARANYNIIKRVITKMQAPYNNRTEYSTKDQCNAILQELALFTSIDNPLLIITPLEFRDMQHNHNILFHQLTVHYTGIRRRRKVIQSLKKVVGCTYVASLFNFCFLGFFKKPNSTYMLRKVQVQLDVAAKGVYMLINDFNTMSRLVRRLNDETEHSKAMADICVRNNGRIEVLKEVVREFRVEESWFFGQLEELEEHVYFCFNSIRTSRRLIAQEN